MDKEYLEKLSLTRLSVVLTEDFMKDNMPHSRSQILDYVKAYAEDNNLPIPEATHINGAIQDLLKKGICERVSTGVYVLPYTEDNSFLNNKIDRLMVETDAFISNMRKVVKSINFMTADEDEERLLTSVRGEVQQLKNWKVELENLMQSESEDLESDESINMGMTL